jgi:hypothetical protein
MRTGTKSLLFGVHQFAWHPVTVTLAWRKLYGKWPTWRESICILVHDWGYWGCEKMDDAKGEEHPILGANLVYAIFRDHAMYMLCRYHSRHHARVHGQEPSALCWPDKLSHIFYPVWLYWFLSTITGEVNEYKGNAEIYLGRRLSNWQYAQWIKAHFRKIAEERLAATAATSSQVYARSVMP